jgi:hypothetical protein
MELESTKLSSQIGAYSTFAAPTSSPQWASVPTMSPGSDGMFSPEMSELEFGNEMENVPPLPPSVPQSPYDIFLPYEAKGVYDGVPLMFGARPQLEIRI